MLFGIVLQAKIELIIKKYINKFYRKRRLRYREIKYNSSFVFSAPLRLCVRSFEIFSLPPC